MASNIYTPDRRDFLRLAASGALGVMAQRYAKAQQAVRRPIAVTAAPVLVQQKVAEDSIGNFSDANTTFTSPITAGNAVIVCVTTTSGGAVDFAGITLNGGGAEALTQSIAAGSSAGRPGVEIWYATNLAGGESFITFGMDPAAQTSVNISEWSGLSNEEALNSNVATASSTVTTNSVTPASANNLVIAMGGWTANNYSSGPINSFTRMTPIGAGVIYQESAYLIQTSATAKSTGWSLIAPLNWAAAIAVFGAP